MHSTQYIQIQESLQINTQIHPQRHKQIITYRDKDKKYLYTLGVYNAFPVSKWICLNPCFAHLNSTHQNINQQITSL